MARSGLSIVRWFTLLLSVCLALGGTTPVAGAEFHGHIDSAAAFLPGLSASGGLLAVRGDQRLIHAQQAHPSHVWCVAAGVRNAAQAAALQTLPATDVQKPSYRGARSFGGRSPPPSLS